MTLYRILGVDDQADAAAIRRAYDALRDRPAPSGWTRWSDWLQGRTPQAIETAYRVLSDPTSRTRYDQMVEATLFPAHVPPGP